MRGNTLFLLAMASMAGFSVQANAAIDLGTAKTFAVLAGTTVTNTGATTVTGNVGLDSGTSITGTGTVTFTAGTMYTHGDIALQAKNDLTAAYLVAAGLTPTTDLTGKDLGGMTLLPGNYSFTSDALLGTTKTLTLDDNGDPNAQFVFQMVSKFTAESDSKVVTINGGSSPAYNVFWQVGSSATLDTGAAFEGHILALDSISLKTGATIIQGSALARNAAVTLEANTITNTVVPEPTMMSLMLGGALLLTRRKDQAGRK